MKPKPNTMKAKIKLGIIFAIVGLLIASFKNCKAQEEIATKANGQKVILSKDGTWKEYETVNNAYNSIDTNNCDYWVYNREDKVTGKSYLAMKDYIKVTEDGVKGFLINLHTASKGNIIFSITVAGLGSCLEDAAKINILFDDNSKLELFSDKDFNCKGELLVFFGGSNGRKFELSELSNKNIEIMRINGKDKIMQVNFKKHQAIQLKNVFKCLSN